MDNKELDKSRAEFEAWAKDVDIENLGGEYAGPGNIGWWYWDDQTAAAWDGWQAALARAGLAAPTATAEPRVPEGYRLVPIEPSTEQLRAGIYTEAAEGLSDSGVTQIYCAMIAAAPTTQHVSAAPTAPTGCELCNSEYGFSCDGKSGQCGAAPTAAVEPSLDADEMRRLRRLVHVLGMDGSANASDEQVRGLLFTALGQAAGKIERATPIAPEAGASLHDSIMNIPCRYTIEVAWDSNDADKPKRCYQEGHHDALHAAAKLVNERIAAMSAAQTQPKDTTDTKEKANG